MFRQNGIETERLTAAQRAGREAEARRQAAIEELIQDFGTTISGAMTELGRSTDTMSTAAATMAQAATGAHRQATGTAERATSNIVADIALPAYQAEFVIDQLKRYGWIRPGWLGLKIQDVNPDIARSIGMSPPRGSIVAWISDGGPAAKAGLQVGDVIVSFEEDTPPDERALLRDISGSAPGRVVKLGVVRNGQTIELTATLEEWPRMMWEEVNAPLKVAPPHWVIPNDLGIKVTELTDKLRSENDVPAGPKGALVTEVRRDTDAARRGLQPGDIIMRIGEVAVETPSDVLAQIEAARKTGRDMADFLVFPKDKGTSKFPSPKWLPLRVSAG